MSTDGSSASIQWGVKRSFRDYVDGIEDARFSCSGGATRAADGTFSWPADRSGEEVHGRGEVWISAYGGMLDVRIADPVLRVDDEVASLVLILGGRETAIATGPVVRSGSHLAATLAATDAGARMLGGTYAPGTPLDDLVVAGDEQ